MMFITGDCHGEWRKFSTESFPEQREMTKDDYVIVTGDFGIWDNSEREKWWFDWMEKKNFTILFVDGNHENFDLLNNYPVSNWKGGKVHFIRPNVIHLMRGEVYEIDGHDYEQIEQTMLEAKNSNKLCAIIANTIKGKGVSFMENAAGWHGKAPNDEQLAKALEELC